MTLKQELATSSPTSSTSATEKDGILDPSSSGLEGIGLKNELKQDSEPDFGGIVIALVSGTLNDLVDTLREENCPFEAHFVNQLIEQCDEYVDGALESGGLIDKVKDRVFEARAAGIENRR